MLALVPVTGWHYVGFIACVLVFLSLDLGVFHRRAHVVRFREALTWTAVWFTLAMLFASGLKPIAASQAPARSAWSRPLADSGRSASGPCQPSGSPAWA